ncbi:Ribonuclease H2 subunit C [Penicillium bovifimosum]|uniref:Ribonuclease H2 subunit C n=1 Tax=Penicillium bovifimosum TaxID=126998 RepID=A0A9W9H5A8_9EURO|nr:Ribonuclease H2 subunit C [Penicillium bovifimosum]KAJ5138950.1 Ribonuclease H2 subunit C [Penicillium bovifimosum]
MPDMYAFQPSSKAPSQSEKNDASLQYTPNIIPCRVHHDGPVESVERYWTPVADKDNTQTAYFRGRKLRGRRVALPDGYRGVVATPTDRVLPSQQADRDAVEDAEPEEPVKVLETHGTFDEIVVWGHEALPAADDMFVKGVEEWLQFADAMHTTPMPATSGAKESVAA